MLNVENICKSYDSKKVVNSISFSLKKGEILGLVGQNGAGKTTTLKIMSGILKADTGKIYLDNVNLLDNISLLKAKIGYMPDYFGMYDEMTVDEYLEFFGLIYDLDEKELEKKKQDVLYLVDLEEKKESNVNDLSRGMKQRLCLARILLHNPDILLLDEPLSGLDPRTRNDLLEILEQLKQLGKIIIISSHLLSELSQICSSIAIVDEGKIVVYGKVNEITNIVDEANPIIISVLNNQEKAVALLRNNPLVKTISSEENKILITFKGNRNNEAMLLRELVMNDIEVVSFNREKGNLESLLLKVTGGSV